MAIGHHNEYTGDPRDGNRSCHHCGDQTPIGFKHHHASEVPALKARIAALEEERSKTIGVLNEIFWWAPPLT